MTQNYYFSAKQNAKRLHGVPKWFFHNVQSPCHRVSHTMTKKNKTNKTKAVSTKAVRQKLRSMQIKKATPFADAGAIAGAGLGNMFGLPFLKGVGKFLGSGIGSIFGSGDYQMVGPVPSYNLLLNGAQIPQFSTTRATNVVSHREYLGDITGNASFINRSFPLNPGLASTFPWLSTIAQNYQEYRFHGLIFEFRPLITDFASSGSPGVVVMATNYNADAPAYTTKQQMENSEFAVSVKPTCGLIHGIECADNQTVLSELYVRTGEPASGQDKRLYDIGLFQFASQANTAITLGELWVSYTVEFFKPILPVDVGGNVLSYHWGRTGTTGALPLGTDTIFADGDLPGVLISSTSITWFAQPGNEYSIAISWLGTSTAITHTTASRTGLDEVKLLNNKSVSFSNSPVNGATTTVMSETYYVKCSLLAPGLVALILSAGVFPTTPFTDIVITQLSNEAV
jgi:hypothetical protein